MSSFLKTSFIHDETAPSLQVSCPSPQEKLQPTTSSPLLPRFLHSPSLSIHQRQTGIAGNVSIYKLLITAGWRTVWTRFSDYRFSKNRVQLSRHRGPHCTKKKFCHAICLCLVRVRKAHCTCNSKSTVHVLMHSCAWSATSRWGHARPSPCPGALCEGWTVSPTVDLRG